MTSQLGVGVCLGLLSGRSQAEVDAVTTSFGKVIKSIRIDDKSELQITFEDDETLTLEDEGQSCCEYRYMTTDDDLEQFVGATLLHIQVSDGGSVEGSEVHEIEFLRVMTDKGTLTVANHNEHNGYYGGFDIRVKLKRGE